jgi:DNA repair exonuclease SbcCD ATPase subunit
MRAQSLQRVSTTRECDTILCVTIRQICVAVRARLRTHVNRISSQGSDAACATCTRSLKREVNEDTLVRLKMLATAVEQRYQVIQTMAENQQRRREEQKRLAELEQKIARKAEIHRREREQAQRRREQEAEQEAEQQRADEEELERAEGELHRRQEELFYEFLGSCSVL